MVGFFCTSGWPDKIRILNVMNITSRWRFSFLATPKIDLSPSRPEMWNRGPLVKPRDMKTEAQAQTLGLLSEYFLFWESQGTGPARVPLAETGEAEDMPLRPRASSLGCLLFFRVPRQPHFAPLCPLPSCLCPLWVWVHSLSLSPATYWRTQTTSLDLLRRLN